MDQKIIDEFEVAGAKLRKGDGRPGQRTPALGSATGAGMGDGPFNRSSFI